MKLYLIVATYVSFDGDAVDTEWLHTVSDEHPTYEEAKLKIENHIVEACDIAREDFDVIDVWVNPYYSVDGYAIKLEKIND